MDPPRLAPSSPSSSQLGICLLLASALPALAAADCPPPPEPPPAAAQSVASVKDPRSQPIQLSADGATLDPNGNTALLDAIGRTIDETGARLAALAEGDRPGKVVIAIMTDGLENASKTCTWIDINEKIRHQKEAYKWEFLFLGANQDAIATAGKLSIAAGDSVTYFQMSRSVTSAMRAASKSMRSSKLREAKTQSLTEMVREEDDKG